LAMLVKYFRKDSIPVYITFVLLSVAIWAKSLMGVGEWEAVRSLEYGTPIELFINQLSVVSPLLSGYMAFALAIVVIAMMQSLNNRYIFIPQRSTIPALLFVLIGFSFVSLQHLTPALAALPFIVLSLNSVFASYRKDYAEGDYFLAGFYVALASIIYLPALVLVLMLFVAILIMRSFSWREWVAMLVGVVLPYVFLVSYYLFFDADALVALQQFDSSKVIASIPKHMNSFFGYGFLAVLTIAFAYASFFMLSWSGTQKVRTNKIFLVFYSIVAIALLAYFAIPTVSKDIMLVVSLPLSYIIGVFMIFTRRTFLADALLVAILTLTVMLQVFME